MALVFVNRKASQAFVVFMLKDNSFGTRLGLVIIANYHFLEDLVNTSNCPKNYHFLDLLNTSDCHYSHWYLASNYKY